MDRITKKYLDHRRWSALEWAIAVNIAVTILVWLSGLLLPMFGLSVGWLGKMLEVKPTVYWLSRHPWSPFVYSFVHSGLPHLLLNMLGFWLIGRRFVEVFGVRRLIPLYIMATLSGALLYILGYQLLWLLGWHPLPLGLVGSSAAIMSLIFALAFYQPWQRLQTPFGLIGYIRLAWLILLLQLLLMFDNLGGVLAHLGGALCGLSFGYLLRERGTDMTRPLARLIDDLLVTLGQKKGKKRRDTERTRRADIETVLSKIRESGYKSLSEAERRLLFDPSDSRDAHDS